MVVGREQILCLENRKMWLSPWPPDWEVRATESREVSGGVWRWGSGAVIHKSEWVLEVVKFIFPDRSPPEEESSGCDLGEPAEVSQRGSQSPRVSQAAQGISQRSTSSRSTGKDQGEAERKE